MVDLDVDVDDGAMERAEASTHVTSRVLSISSRVLPKKNYKF